MLLVRSDWWSAGQRVRGWYVLSIIHSMVHSTSGAVQATGWNQMTNTAERMADTMQSLRALERKLERSGAPGI